MVNPHDIMFLRAGDDEQARRNGALAPLTHPPQDLGFMREYDVELPENFHDDLDAQPYGVRSYKRSTEWNYGSIPGDREDLWKVRRNYLINCLRMVDQEFQKILDELDRLDLWRNTVVLFTSDHGEMNGAHGLAQKGAIPFQEAAVVNMTVVSPPPADPAASAATRWALTWTWHPRSSPGRAWPKRRSSSSTPT